MKQTSIEKSLPDDLSRHGYGNDTHLRKTHCQGKNIVGEKKRLAKTEFKKTHYKKSYSHFKTGEILE